jgi:hypothetical protein
MNKFELNNHINKFIENKDEIGVSVYAILKEESKPRKLDIQQKDLPALKKMFLDQLDDHIVKDNDLAVLKLSSSDERKKVLYEYDIEIPTELMALDEIKKNDGYELFDFNKNKIDDVTALLIEVGNNESQLVLYKTMARVNIYGRSSFFLKKSNKRFEKINDEFFRISSNFQLISVAGSLVVVDLNTIEKFFGFHEVIKKEAELGIKEIKAISLLENPETLEELVDDIPFARKLTKIAKSSPVLKAKISNEKIIDFCKNFPSLKGKIRFNSDESKIQLDTKVSKDLFVKILMDDFLTSELTNYHYTSLAKDSVHEDQALQQAVDMDA